MKIGILTINDNNNYGNRLQNYAVQQIVAKYAECETIKNLSGDSSANYLTNMKYLIKKFSPLKKHQFSYKRYKNFLKFNNNINFSKCVIKNYNVPSCLDSSYDFFITGSDQVWNPNFSRLSNVDLLTFASHNKRISFSASFGVSKLSNEHCYKIKEELSKFKSISVREEAAQKIVEKLTKRKDVELLLDPTLMLPSSEWEKLTEKPKMLKENKFILVYFLGKLSSLKMKQIEKFAEENDCKIINVMDPDDEFYSCGPSEFLYLEKNAFMICTDSFHSSVFAIIFNRPFIVYEREDESGICMNSRIETLIKTLKLKKVKYDGKITTDILNCDYTKSFEILNEEKEKVKLFLENAFINID